MSKSELLENIQNLIYEYEEFSSELVGCGVLFEDDGSWFVFNGEKFEESKNE